MTNMGKLFKYLTEYDGSLTEDNINQIASEYNTSAKLSLTEDQIGMVLKKFLATDEEPETENNGSERT